VGIFRTAVDRRPPNTPDAPDRCGLARFLLELNGRRRCRYHSAMGRWFRWPPAVAVLIGAAACAGSGSTSGILLASALAASILTLVARSVRADSSSSSTGSEETSTTATSDDTSGTEATTTGTQADGTTEGGGTTTEPDTTSGPETTTGPCLAPLEDAGTGGEVGPCLTPHEGCGCDVQDSTPSALLGLGLPLLLAARRRDAVERLAKTGVLPPDVVARLRR
jgi:hypothetical protein